MALIYLSGAVSLAIVLLVQAWWMRPAPLPDPNATPDPMPRAPGR